MHTWKSRENFLESVFSPSTMLAQCEAQVMRFGSKLLHPLNNLTGHLLQAYTREKNLRAQKKKRKSYLEGILK